MSKPNTGRTDKKHMKKLLLGSILFLIIIPVAVYGQDDNLTFEQFFNINHFHQGDILTLTNTDSVSHKIRIYNSTNPLINSLGVIAPTEQLQMLLPSEGDYYFYDELNPSYHGEFITHQSNVDLGQFTNEQNTISFGYSNSTQITFSNSSTTNSPPITNDTNSLPTSNPVTPPNPQTNDTNITPTNQTAPQIITTTQTTVTTVNKTTTMPTEPPVSTTVTNTVTTTKTTNSDNPVLIVSQSTYLKIETIRTVLGLPSIDTIMQVTIINK